MTEKEKQKIVEEVKSQLSKEKLDEIEIKTIEKRLDGLKEAVQRGRSVFVVIIIACTATLFTIWNSNFSRERSIAFDSQGNTLERAFTFNKTEKANQSQSQQNQSQPKSEAEPLNIYGIKTLVSEWYKSRSIQVNLLGIKVDVGDLSLIGSFSLVVLTIWYFYSQRQVNRLIIELLNDVSSQSESNNKKVRNLIFYGIAQNALFTKYKSPQAIQSSAKSKMVDVSPKTERKNKENDPNKGQNNNNENSKSFWHSILIIAIIIPFLIFLPLIIFLLLLPLLHYMIASAVLIFVVFLILFAFRKKFRNLTQTLSNRLLTESDKAKGDSVIINSNEKKSFSDRVVVFLFHLPFWTIVAIITRDILNLCMVSPMRGNTLPKLDYISKSLSDYLLPSLEKYGVPIGLDIMMQALIDKNYFPVILVLLFDGFAIACAFYILILCDESMRFSDENIQALTKFAKETE